jgi:hypothetical protein
VKAVNPSLPPKHPPSHGAERFSRVRESVKDLPPKEQASRVRDHFGILGGARPAEGRDRKGKRLRRLTLGEVQRLEQRSHTRPLEHWRARSCA